MMKWNLSQGCKDILISANQYDRASLEAQTVNNLPSMWEIGVQSLGWEDPLRREWQPSPVFLPGEFHGQRSLAGYSPWGHKDVDTTEQLTTSVICHINKLKNQNHMIILMEAEKPSEKIQHPFIIKILHLEVLGVCTELPALSEGPALHQAAPQSVLQSVSSGRASGMAHSNPRGSPLPGDY